MIFIGGNSTNEALSCFLSFPLPTLEKERKLKHLNLNLCFQDIVAKVLSFAQQRPRAVCVLSGNGTVSSVTLRQPASTGVSVTYEVE